MSAPAIPHDILACPCCKGKVRLTRNRGKARLEIVLVTKPEVKWEPQSVRAERELRAVCERRGVDFEVIAGPKRDRMTSDLRREAVIATRVAGFSYAVIGRLLNRDSDTVRTLYGARS